MGPTSGEDHSTLDAKKMGHIPFGNRPADVQTVVATMYGNSSRIRTASGVFVLQAPLSVHGCASFDISAAGLTTIAGYPFASSPSGTPAEVVVGDASHVQLYSPHNNVTASISRAHAEALPPIATIPLGRIVPETSSSTLTGGSLGRGIAGFVDLFFHPTFLVASRFFTNKKIEILGNVSYGGRDAWELEGTQVASAPQESELGNHWRMWVDKESGVVVRLEYYSDTHLLGWIEMQNLVINEHGTPLNSPAWSIPSTARTVDFDTFNRLPRP